MRIEKGRVFRKNPQAIYKEKDGAGVLIDPYRRSLFRLNTAAAEVWRLLDGYRSCGAIIEEFKKAFEGNEHEFEKDINCLLNELFRLELIE